jgi:hypothetical protein
MNNREPVPIAQRIGREPKGDSEIIVFSYLKYFMNEHFNNEINSTFETTIILNQTICTEFSDTKHPIS